MLLYYGLVQYCYGRCCRLVGPTHEINRLLLIAETKSSENCTTKKKTLREFKKKTLKRFSSNVQNASNDRNNYIARN